MSQRILYEKIGFLYKNEDVNRVIWKSSDDSNIVVTAGANYNNSTANHLVAYGVPTANNEIIVPAKKALVVAGADQGTAIEDVTVQPVQKFFRDGQIYIIRDGVVYTITGNVVR